MSATISLQDLTITTIGEFFEAGGFLMWPILGCSVVVLGLAIERYLSLRRRRLLPVAVVDAVEDLGRGHEDAAAAAVHGAAAPAARVLAAGLRRRGFALPEVEKAMEDQLLKEGARLRSHVRGISLMAAVAPLLGLLGTVVGIAEAFATVEQTGLGKPENLAAGIKVALYTTIFGLCVAIPATLIAAHLHGRVRQRLMQVAETVAPAVEALAGRRGETHAA
jgi:biopolymer transport protein ExbB